MIEKHIEDLLADLGTRFGFDVANDANFDNTPRRVAKAYGELLQGYTEDPAEILKTAFPSDSYDQMIACVNIDFYSICSHHMLPFFGRASVAYIPGEHGKVVGLSKLARIVHTYARRFQIQERLTSQVANALADHLKPRGVGVLIEADHLCMKMRGIKQHESSMVTSCVLGEFRDDPAVRSEFFALVNK